MSTGESRPEILQGTLDLMVLRTLETMGAQHGFGLAKRIQQVSDGALSLNQGTLYPRLLRLAQRGAKCYEITRAGRKQVERESRDWARTVAIMQRFVDLAG